MDRRYEPYPGLTLDSPMSKADLDNEFEATPFLGNYKVGDKAVFFPGYLSTWRYIPRELLQGASYTSSMRLCVS